MKMNLFRALHKHSAVRAGVIASKRSARTLAAPWSAGLTPQRHATGPPLLLLQQSHVDLFINKYRFFLCILRTRCYGPNCFCVCAQCKSRFLIDLDHQVLKGHFKWSTFPFLFAVQYSVMAFLLKTIKSSRNEQLRLGKHCSQLIDH